MFFNTPIKVRRNTTGSYVDGVWKAGQPRQFTVQASVQPTNVNDMALLPQGREYQQTFALYSARPLREANQDTGTDADIVTIAGREYTVIRSERWQNRLIPHWKTIVELRHV